MKNKLPDKPSKLLRVAMEDLEWVESNPNYAVNMANWHEPLTNNKCSVCHAGAVMAHTLKIPINEVGNLYEAVLGKEAVQKLRAIDYIRQGTVYLFFSSLEIKPPESLDMILSYDIHLTRSPCYYSQSKDLDEFEIYKNWIVSFIGILEAEGL